jgi:SAM-dependent methyltransferase
MGKHIKQHWENVYETKHPNEVSWTQEIPQTSLDMIRSFKLPASAKIIDIGGGDSKLVDYLLQEGYNNITVLDISEKAIEKAKQRLGTNANKVNWIVANILDFNPSTTYDIWHDRAAFHFLTEEEQVEKYLSILKKSVVTGYAVIGTFSNNGPIKCSGLYITQYDEEKLMDLLENDFYKINCLTEDHTTPFNTIQNFLFCSFKRKTI